jgi:DNA-binding beta-propeller fold protein YncE
MHFVSEGRDRRVVAVGSALIALAFVAVLAFAARAQAAETIYWDNYGASPANVAYSDITGSGGGVLNIGMQEIESPEGMAYDSVTNRLFVANEAGTSGQILAINLDGSGATPFTAPGAPIEEPEGVAVDPVSRTIYWLNTDGAGSIAWAKLDGSAGGVLNTSGATFESPCCRIAIDPVGGRIYWMNQVSGPNIISFANLNNTGGGGDLNLAGSAVAPGTEGLAIDSSAGRLYFTGREGTEEAIGYANLNGSGGGNVLIGGAFLNEPWGLAFDPSIHRLYWANEGNSAGENTDAIGFVNSDGSGVGGISPSPALVDNPQDPVILKSPTGTGAPAITRDAKNRAALSCPTGSWGADYVGGSVYQAPRTFGYQWLLNGAPVAGATASTLTATKAGSYTCTVTATNQTGSASQTSAAVTVKAAKVKLTVKPKTAKVKAGKIAVLKVKALNQGDLQTKNAKVCVKVPGKAKKFLKAKCKSLGKVAARKTKSTKLKIKVKASAEGSYKVKVQIKGASGKVVKATVKILG